MTKKFWGSIWVNQNIFSITSSTNFNANSTNVFTNSTIVCTSSTNQWRIQGGHRGHVPPQTMDKIFSHLVIPITDRLYD